MLKTILIILACTAIVTSTGARAADPATPSLATMNKAAIDGYIVPRLQVLKQRTERLAAHFAKACEGQGRQLGAAREQFAETVKAWAEVEFLRFGPMAVDARPERFSFWPDPRGVVDRQMRRAISRKDPDVLDPALLEKKSVAIQGLPALEALLTSDKHPILGDGAEARFRCGYAVAIAKNLKTIAGNVVAGWVGETGWRETMLSPGPDNPRYKTVSEASAELVRALLTGLQIIQDRVVIPLITAEKRTGKRPRLPFARAGLSSQYASASIAGNKAYFEAMGLARFVPNDDAWIKDWMKNAFSRLARDAPHAVQESGKEKKDDPERTRELRILRFHVSGLRSLIGRKIVPSAGLTIGFNELDGD